MRDEFTRRLVELERRIDRIERETIKAESKIDQADDRRKNSAKQP